MAADWVLSLFKGTSPLQPSKKDTTSTAEAASYCDILGRGIDFFKFPEGATATMDQALLTGEVLPLSRKKVPLDLGKGRHVSLPCNIKRQPGSRTIVYNTKALQEKTSKVHDTAALLNGQYHVAYLEARSSGGSSEVNKKTHITQDEHAFHSQYRLFINTTGIFLIPKVEEQIPADGNTKAMATFLRKFATHAVTGIEIGGWHDARYSFNQGGSGARSTASGGAGVGLQAPTGEGFQAAFNIERSSRTAVDQVDEQFVRRQSGGGRQIMMTTFTPLSDFVKDPTKKQVLEDAIAKVARAPRAAALRWDLESFLDFSKVKETKWIAPPCQEKNAAGLAFRKLLRFLQVYINTQQVLMAPGAGAPTGICLCIEQENQISVSLQRTQNLPWLFQQRGFDSAVGEWRDAHGKAHVQKLRDHFIVDCREVSPEDIPPGETRVVTGLQLVFTNGKLALRCHFSPLKSSDVKQTVWRGCDEVSSEPSSSASPNAKPKKPPPETGIHSYVDTTEYSYGLDEEFSKMHWVLVGARLDVVSGSNEKDKLSIRGKFALLKYT